MPPPLFPQGNPEGQTTLASTILPLPSGVGRGSAGADDEHASFGSILVRALVAGRGQGDLEASCRAAGVLLHILKDNRQCKERVSEDRAPTRRTRGRLACQTASQTASLNLPAGRRVKGGFLPLGRTG